MHVVAQEQLMGQLAQAESDVAVRLGNLAGVADAAARVDPEVPATIRFGDPTLYELQRRQARMEVMEEALAKLEGGSVDTSGAPVQNVRELPGVGADLAAALEAHGFDSAQKIAEADAQDLKAVPGVGDKKAAELKEAASG